MFEVPQSFLNQKEIRLHHTFVNFCTTFFYRCCWSLFAFFFGLLVGVSPTSQDCIRCVQENICCSLSLGNGFHFSTDYNVRLIKRVYTSDQVWSAGQIGTCLYRSKYIVLYIFSRTCSTTALLFHPPSRLEALTWIWPCSLFAASNPEISLDHEEGMIPNRLSIDPPETLARAIR